MAPVKHALWGVKKPIPPFYKISFVFTRALDEFFIHQAAKDTTKYYVQLINPTLYVKVASLQQPLWQQLSSRLDKEEIKYFFCKVKVKVEQVSPNNASWAIDNLFPDNEIPTRVFITFVKNSELNSDVNSTPYNFRRRWLMEVAASVQSKQPSQDDIDKTMEQRLSRTMEEINKATAIAVNEAVQRALKAARLLAGTSQAAGLNAGTSQAGPSQTSLAGTSEAGPSPTQESTKEPKTVAEKKKLKQKQKQRYQNQSDTDPMYYPSDSEDSESETSDGSETEDFHSALSNPKQTKKGKITEKKKMPQRKNSKTNAEKDIEAGGPGPGPKPPTKKVKIFLQYLTLKCFGEKLDQVINFLME
jgi:hypothetical protein